MTHRSMTRSPCAVEMLTRAASSNGENRVALAELGHVDGTLRRLVEQLRTLQRHATRVAVRRDLRAAPAPAPARARLTRFALTAERRDRRRRQARHGVVRGRSIDALARSGDV